MATAKWIAGSLNKRQEDRITCSGTGDWASNDVITITIANVGVTITLGSAQTDAQVATTIYQAWEGIALTDTAAVLSGFSIADGGIKAIPQFSEFTATNTTAGRVDLLSNGSGALAGKPVTMTVTETVAGDETAAETTFSTPTSQYHANQVDNWHLNAVPGSGDTIIFDVGNVDVRYSLDLGNFTVAQLTKYKTYTGNVGLANVNTDNNSKPYPEYRTPTYLTADAFTNCDLEVGPGQGSGRFKLDAGAGASTFNIYGKGTRAEPGVPCILLIGTSTSNVVRNLAGDVGLAFFGGEAMSLTTLTTGDGPSSQASTICGSGVTFSSATVTCNGGFLETNSALATGVQNGGTWIHKLGTITALTVNGGTFLPNGAATITTLTLGSGGVFDASKGNAAFTITNSITMTRGAKFIDPQGRTIAGGLDFVLSGCKPSEVTIDLPPGRTYTIT